MLSSCSRSTFRKIMMIIIKNMMIMMIIIRNMMIIIEKIMIMMTNLIKNIYD